LASISESNNNRLAKRLKDEALSNSSSSDEESEAQRQKLCQTGLQNSKNKLQQITAATKTPQPMATATASTTSAARLNVNTVQQPRITPVVSQAAALAQQAEKANQSVETKVS